MSRGIRPNKKAEKKEGQQDLVLLAVYEKDLYEKGSSHVYELIIDPNYEPDMRRI